MVSAKVGTPLLYLFCNSRPCRLLFQQRLWSSPGDRLLCLVWMRWASINLEVGHNIRPQAIMHHHALYRMLQSTFRIFSLQRLPQCGLLQTTWILAMAVIHLLIQALARDSDLVSVDHTHKITTLQVWCECRLMLPTQNLRNL